MYKESLEKKNKCAKINLIYQNRENDNDINIVHLDINDYLVNPNNGENYFVSSSSKWLL